MQPHRSFSAPLDMTASHPGPVTAVEGRRGVFEIVACDEIDEVARVQLRRCLVDKARLAAPVKMKSDKAS